MHIRTLQPRPTRRAMALVWAALAVLVLTAVPSWADDDEEDAEAEVGQVVVKLAPNTTATIQQVNATYGTRVLETMLVSGRIYLLQLPEGADDDVIEAMEDDPDLVYAEPNYVSEIPEANPRMRNWTDGTAVWAGTDPTVWRNQHAVRQLGLAEAHRRAKGTGTLVAVLDTGVQPDHPALRDRLARGGYDFVEDRAGMSDPANGRDDDGDGLIDEAVGHGTHVSGIVALTAPRARILPLRVLNSDGKGNVFLAAEAMQRALNARADVINLSFGTSGESELLEDLVEEAEERGVVVVASAGNGGVRQEQHPAAEDDVLAVTAIGPTNRRSAFANFGSWVDVGAPGEDIASAYPRNGYATWDGTSMAAPFVAGQAALLLNRRPGLDVECLTAVIRSTARTVTGLRHGRIDLVASLDAVVDGTCDDGDDDDDDDG